MIISLIGINPKFISGNLRNAIIYIRFGDPCFINAVRSRKTRVLSIDIILVTKYFGLIKSCISLTNFEYKKVCIYSTKVPNINTLFFFLL